MDPRVATIIQTDESEGRNVHFEWNMSKTVNVVCTWYDRFDPEKIDQQEIIDTFGFSEQPTLEQVVIACEEYFND
jgi:hypothetical protein